MAYNKGSPKAEANKPSPEYKLKESLLLLATLVATVTYAAGLNLPGGVWQEGPSLGDPILRDTHYNQYIMFYYCNATAFAASLVVCLLLLVIDEESTYFAAVLRVVMVLDLLSLMGAYAAGSCRDAFTTIYSAVIMAFVFLYIVLSFFFYIVKLHQNNGNKEDKDHGEHKNEDLHEALMLLATFAITITYVAGLNPPGGFWSSPKHGHRVSKPVLQDLNSSRYQSFFFYNTTAFVASLLIVMLLLNKNIIEMTTRISVRFIVLYGSIVTALFGLVGAYAAGSCRELDNTIYVVCLIGAVLAYIFLQLALTKAIKNEKITCLVTISKWLAKLKSSISKWLDKQGQHGISGDTTHNEAMEKDRNLVMLLATLAAAITYQAGLDPPGGLWPDDRDGHKGGRAVLLTTDPIRYKVFFYSNSVAFVTSLVAIIMVQSSAVLKGHTLEAAMILDLFALILAYAAGSCREVSSSIYVVSLAGVVLIYVVIHIIFFTLDDMDNHQGDIAKELDKKREVLLLLAILAATLTYQAGLTPPGGFWPDNLGHHPGFPILLNSYTKRYKAFFYCNATSFMASIALIVLLVNPTIYRPGIRSYALYVCMVAGLFGLMGAYAAGSSRHLRTSIYVLILVAAVFTLITMQIAIFWRKKKSPNKSTDVPKGGDITNEAPSAPKESDIGEGPSSKPEAQPAISGKSETSGSRDSDMREYMREYLMLLGVLAASVTYQAGLKPPGGLWQDNTDVSIAGHSILHDINKRRYNAFFYSNSTSFMASIVVIILLLPWTLHHNNLPLWPMHTAILLDMFGLLAAYAAGSTMEWETSRNVIALVVPVLVCIAAYAAVSLFRKKKQILKKEPASSNPASPYAE